MLFQNGWLRHKIHCRTLLLVVLCFISFQSFAVHRVTQVEATAEPDGAQISFVLSGSEGYKVFTLANPDRVVIDVKNTHWNIKKDQNRFNHLPISKIRHAVNEQGTLRMVLDVQSTPRILHHELKATGTNAKTLTIKIGLKTVIPTQDTNVGGGHRAGPSKDTTVSSTATPVDLGIVSKTRPYRVAIDPGHGGEDTGAIGNKHAIREKDIVLAVSKKLQALINAEPGMEAFLVRKGDYFVSLRKRMNIAREQGADLFISVHADAFEDPRARGASVYVLSEKGASNEAARWLAEKENRSDLIGGVSLEDKNPVLASVLLDLSQTASQAASHELGTHIIKQLSKTTELHHKTVQSAGFAVLKSPDIPSVLVELGFISNFEGEKQLLDATHQKSLALAILSGVKAYAEKRPLLHQPPENWMIAKHKTGVAVASKN